MKCFSQRVEKLKLVVMLPAYNEEKTIGSVISRVPRKLPGIKDIEILVMDDSSTDKTAEIAKKAGADWVFLNKKKGLGYNFKNGVEHCLKLGADVIVNIDADGQFNPDDIPSLIQPILAKEADMVTCSRFINPDLVTNMPWVKKWGNKKFTRLVSKIAGDNFTDTQCGFRAYSKEAALRLNLQGAFTYTQEVFIDLAEKGMRIKEIPLAVKYFKKRQSAISSKLIRYGLKSLGIIAKATRDTQPLTFFGMPGLILFLTGLGGAGYSFWFWATHLMTTPIRTLFNVSIFFIISGLSLIILGLLADMLKRMNITQEEILYKLKKQETDKK